MLIVACRCNVMQIKWKMHFRSIHFIFVLFFSPFSTIHSIFPFPVITISEREHTFLFAFWMTTSLNTTTTKNADSGCYEMNIWNEWDIIIGCNGCIIRLIAQSCCTTGINNLPGYEYQTTDQCERFLFLCCSLCHLHSIHIHCNARKPAKRAQIKHITFY